MKNRRESVALIDKDIQKQNEIDSNRTFSSQGDHWSQLRLVTGQVSSRSYHTITYYSGKLYIYGGYELHTGVKDDFIEFDYSSTHLGVPAKVQASGLSNSPGPIYRHTACEFKGKLVVFGGKKSSMSNSNRLCRFDFASQTWEEVFPGHSQKEDRTGGEISQRGIAIPSVESHSSAVDTSTGKMYVFGGFEKTFGFSNSVTAFDLVNDTFCSVQTVGTAPSARSSHSASILNSNMYVFGGSNPHSKRLADFWKLDLSSYCWTEITVSSATNPPQARSGHSMSVFENHVIIFGGILGVTREVNDVFAFDTKSAQWKNLENSGQENLNGLSTGFNTTQNNFQQKKPSRKFSRFNTDHNGIEQHHQVSSTFKKQQKQQDEWNNRKRTDFKNSSMHNHSILNDFRFQETRNKSNSKLSSSSVHQSPVNSVYESQRPSMQLFRKQAIRHAFNLQSNAYQHLSIESPIMSPNNWGIQSSTPPSQSKKESQQGKFFLPLLDQIKDSEGQVKSSHQTYSNTHRQKSDSVFQFDDTAISSISPSSSFISFPKRVQKFEEMKPLQANPMKESLNMLFDKIKCVGLNTLISKEEKYNLITDLRKRILLREFVDSEEPTKGKRNFEGNLGESEESQNLDKASERFRVLKTPTTDTMMKAIKATHSKSIHDHPHRITSTEEFNYSTIAQFKSVLVENCRIRRIRPQPRDGHAAIVVGNQLIILGGDRHRLSFNDMFECDLVSLLDKFDQSRNNHS